MPNFLFANQACFFVYYTIMGYQFDNDKMYNPALDEVIGASTIVDDDAPPIDYRDDANRHERGQRTLAGTNPPPLPQVKAADLQFPNEKAEVSLSDDDDDDPNDEDYIDDTPTNLEDTLNQEHTITAVLGITDIANAMATQEEQIIAEEDNDGAINGTVNETEGVDNIEELQQQLLHQVADVDAANDNNTASDSNTATNSTIEYNTSIDSITATNSTTEKKFKSIRMASRNNCVNLVTQLSEILAQCIAYLSQDMTQSTSY
jgi:hypothetical protein